LRAARRRLTAAAAQRHRSRTVAPNFLGDTDAARSAYGAETYARLVALKNEYDPTNVFRLNQNIEPAAA
jgi:FAD/FMN-containing dehydrogenase